jgi:hypothetical protein
VSTQSRRVSTLSTRAPQGTKGGAVFVSRLNLVDLAGSEKVAKAGEYSEYLRHP